MCHIKVYIKLERCAGLIMGTHYLLLVFSLSYVFFKYSSISIIRVKISSNLDLSSLGLNKLLLDQVP